MRFATAMCLHRQTLRGGLRWACCIFAVALNKKTELAWCKHKQNGEAVWRHTLKLSQEEQAKANVIVGRLSETGVPEKAGDASGGGGGGGKRKGSSFQRQAAGSAKRRV